MKHRPILVTGGAGFIGSALVRHLVLELGREVVNVDNLTYAGNLSSLAEAREHPLHHFEQVDIADAQAVRAVFEQYRPAAVMHLAAESHVDRSIDGPGAFIRTNLLGTYTMLEEARRYWSGLDGDAQQAFRFLHVSTDEVYGSLGAEGYFTETTPYDPHSPYSASKAGSDHLARAWHHTYGLPVLVTNCSNNYGPYQYPEKLIPVIILSALRRDPIPVYGTGENVRDWLFVEDHVRALVRVLEAGAPGETYNVGGDSEKQNIEVVRAVCRILDETLEDGFRHEDLITFVTDRPGHDLRYALDASKLRTELGWSPSTTFDEGLRCTVHWYFQHQGWCDEVLRGARRLERLGLAGEPFGAESTHA